MANEKRLIDANALCENIKKQFCEQCKAQGKVYQHIVCSACNIDDALLEIEDAPTVDAVEVVRCKDCRKCHTYKDVITNVKQYKCYLWNASREVDADSFCDAGERWMPLPEPPKGE